MRKDSSESTFVTIFSVNDILSLYTAFRDIISPSHDVFKPEFGRYHLYIAYACPWANRCLAVLKIKGLSDCIGVSIVHPTWQRSRPNNVDDHHCGWKFDVCDDQPLTSATGHGVFAPSGCTRDYVNGVAFVRDLYELTGSPGSKFTVPILWDKSQNTIVNNESSEIIRMLTIAFDEWATGPLATLDLYPLDLRSEIDTVNEWIYPGINDGVYRCGFAKTQAAYDEAIGNLVDALDRLEDLLSHSRYLVGNRFTEADLRLFMTLVRFDEVYVVYFKCNVKRIVDYPNIRQYCRDVYQFHGVADSINMEHIKMHYFTSHPILNAYSIIPKGPNALADMLLPHNRHDF